jgi:hypothetical protein
VEPQPFRSLSVDLDSLDYETLSGTLAPNQGGVLSENLTSWPKNCRFTLTVPETSMSSETAINFTMSIPTKASYDANSGLDDHLIIRLAPDGETFVGPITVEGTWMPWMGAPPDTLYYNSLSGASESGMAMITYWPSINRYRVSFQVDHFSDWEVCPEPPRPPDDGG